MPLASIFFLIFLLLGLKIFSTVKGIIAVFSPSLTYLHLLFILLLCISQLAASVKQLFWPSPDSSAAVGVVWRSSTVAGFQSFRLLPLTLTEIKTYCPSDGASGPSRKIFRKKGLLITQNRGYLLWKMAAFTGTYETAEGPLLYASK